MQSALEHVDVPRHHVSAEFEDFMFQIVDLVFEVVDVQVLRTDCELDQRGPRPRQRVIGTKRHHQHHNSSPHRAAAAAADEATCNRSYTRSSRPSRSMQLSTEMLCYTAYNGALQTHGTHSRADCLHGPAVIVCCCQNRSMSVLIYIGCRL